MFFHPFIWTQPQHQNSRLTNICVRCWWFFLLIIHPFAKQLSVRETILLFINLYLRHFLFVVLQPLRIYLLIFLWHFLFAVFLAFLLFEVHTMRYKIKPNREYTRSFQWKIQNETLLDIHQMWCTFCVWICSPRWMWCKYVVHQFLQIICLQCKMADFVDVHVVIGTCCTRSCHLWCYRWHIRSRRKIKWINKNPTKSNVPGQKTEKESLYATGFQLASVLHFDRYRATWEPNNLYGLPDENRFELPPFAAVFHFYLFSPPFLFINLCAVIVSRIVCITRECLCSKNDLIEKGQQLRKACQQFERFYCALPPLRVRLWSAFSVVN